MLLTAELFQRADTVLAQYQDQFRYLMVDEYQDTNRVQYELMRFLGAGHGNVCVVGDDDQCIYRWRGADLRNILDFEGDFPGARVLRLEQNYRSTQNILAAAGAVIQHNRGRKGKTLWTDNPAGERITVYTASDERAEARQVVALLRQLERSGHHGGDVGAFYRTNAQSRALEEELVRARIAYTIVGSTRFYDRKEVKDLLAYLRVVANADDSVSLLRIINEPPRGIGKTTVLTLEQLAAQRGLPLAAVIADAARVDIPPASCTRLAEFDALCRRLRAAAAGPVTTLLRTILSETGYLDRLHAQQTPEAESRCENVEELLTVAAEFDGPAVGVNSAGPLPDGSLGPAESGRPLDAFLEQVALIADVDTYAAAADRVTLMTLHNSKGLEFPVVFILGLEEGLFPHERSLTQPEAIEEERRLCYVGCTRARQRLYLLHAQRRHLFGRTQENLPSRFLAEIPDHLVHRDGDVVAAAEDEITVDYSYSQVPQRSRSAWRRPAAASADTSGFRVGQRISHPQFGAGIVRAVEGSGERTKLTVRFEHAGVKKLMAHFAGLERIDH